MKTLLITWIATAVLSSMSMVEFSEKDKEFVKEAADMGMLEVKLGELAQKNGSAASVKKLGQHMIKDHGKANDELKVIAKKNGMSLPTTLSEKSQKKYDELATKTGANFDKAFSECMVEDHKEVLNLFEKAAKNVENSDLKVFASKTQPILEHHLYMSKETCEILKENK